MAHAIAASRRYEAVEWLRKMEQGASEVLPEEPSEEEFCLALRNGLILSNVLNKVNPGAVLKVLYYISSNHYVHRHTHIILKVFVNRL